ncbi:hypothetical protein CJ030_MR8G005829 [Morella rubra]|uniref:Uncharacterized protein n=1 Tax=Morella rubra TaxID=262757 RepID=A0A6A1UQU3_9ROSI|nr:hypothetical protein CJ030_MR8G005829 [Morella rubra]
MKLFENELTLDLDLYVLVLKVRTWVTNAYEVLVEHEPHWFLKEPPLPPLPHVEDFGLIEVPLEFLRLDYTSPALSAESSCVSPEAGIIDLTSDTDEEI